MFPYQVNAETAARLEELREEISQIPRDPLSQRALKRIRDYFRIHHIYHSNAIEGNSLTLSETRVVVQEGLTIGGKPLKDHTEAINLNFALDYVEELVSSPGQPLAESIVKNSHNLVLRGIDSDNAGRYRTINVRIQGSDHIPPEAIFVPEQMEEFGRWLAGAEQMHPALRAAVAHTWLVSIHPFADGNGRTARLLMNLALQREDYPIALIRKEDRHAYYEALETSRGGDLSDFLNLLIDRISDTAAHYREAIQEDRRAEQWAENLAGRAQAATLRRKRIEFDIWRRAMELLRAQFQDRADLLQDRGVPYLKVTVRLYDTIDYDKFESLRAHQATPQTWFFGVRPRVDHTEERFGFFFGWPSYQFENLFPNKPLDTVALRIGRWTEGSYQALEDTPVRLREVIFLKDQFYSLEFSPEQGRLDAPGAKRPSMLAEEFFDDVMKEFFHAN